MGEADRAPAGTDREADREADRAPVGIGREAERAAAVAPNCDRAPLSPPYYDIRGG